MITEAEKHQLHTISLSEYQKKVLAKAVLAGSIDNPSKVALGDEKLTVLAASYESKIPTNLTFCFGCKLNGLILFCELKKSGR